MSNIFFEDFCDVLERISTFACPIILLGDINLHLDDVSDPNTVKFQTVMDSHGLKQHVTSPTHCTGHDQQDHILDVVITELNRPVLSVDVEPPVISDHSFITVTVDLQFNHGQFVTSVRRRRWRNFDFTKFCDDLNSSTLLCDPRMMLPVYLHVTMKLCCHWSTNTPLSPTLNYVLIQMLHGMIMIVTW